MKCGVFQQMLDLDRHIVSRCRLLAMKSSHDGDSMADAIEKIRIAESDMLRAGGYLSPDVPKDDAGWHDPEAPLIDRHDGAVPAQVLATPACFGIARDTRVTSSVLQMGVPGKLGETPPVRNDEA